MTSRNLCIDCFRIIQANATRCRPCFNKYLRTERNKRIKKPLLEISPKQRELLEIQWAKELYEKFNL